MKKRDLSHIKDLDTAKDFINQLLDKIDELVAKVDKQAVQIKRLEEIAFGKKSAKRSKDDDSGPNVPAKPKKTKLKKSEANGRKKLPKDLPRVSIEHDISKEQSTCTSCQNSKLKYIGEVVTEQLEHIPEKFYVIKHKRYKYACPCCNGNVVVADMPPQPIDKGLPGPGLLSEVLINKFMDSLPLYRQIQRFKTHGIDLASSTLSDWVAQSAFLLEPLVHAMKEDALLPSNCIFSDDTTVPVLDKNKNKSHTGRFWVYMNNGSNTPLCVIYDYTKTRAQTFPKDFLDGYSGYLHADAYAGYNILCLTGSVIKCICWAHAKRKFNDIIKACSNHEIASKAEEFIGQLYKIESESKELEPDKKRAYRRRYSKPILIRFNRWLSKQLKVAMPKSAIGLALGYIRNNWRELINYLRDGFLEIDNNRAERAIKPLVIGRKNWMFAGSHKAAKNAAIIYSLIETCKLNNVNPRKYFADVLARLPSCKITDINKLLPYNWSAIEA